MTKILNDAGAVINDVILAKDESIYCSTNNELLYKIDAGGLTGIQRKLDLQQEAIEDIDPSDFPVGQPISTMANISQMVLTKNEHFLIMAVNDKNKPGCLRICNFPLTDKVFEIQSHNRGIS
jgi:hypothetical protein